MKEMTRRDFFKLSAAAALLIGGGGGLTGCSDNSLPVMFGDVIDMGDAYVQFRIATIPWSDNSRATSESVNGQYAVLIRPKDGKTVTVKKSDFGAKFDGIEPKEYMVVWADDGQYSVTEQGFTFTETKLFFYSGVLIENRGNVTSGSPEAKLLAKLAEEGVGVDKEMTIKAEASLTHKGKTARAVTYEISNEPFGS